MAALIKVYCLQLKYCIGLPFSSCIQAKVYNCIFLNILLDLTFAKICATTTLLTNAEEIFNFKHMFLIFSFQSNQFFLRLDLLCNISGQTLFFFYLIQYKLFFLKSPEVFSLAISKNLAYKVHFHISYKNTKKLVFPLILF